jgi:hypothetical protein
MTAKAGLGVSFRALALQWLGCIGCCAILRSMPRHFAPARRSVSYLCDQNSCGIDQCGIISEDKIL